MNVTNDYSVFDPQGYLREYYADIGTENIDLLHFLIRSFRQVPADSLVLDFGGGPTLYGALVAAGYVRELHLADYFASNLQEVRRWLNREPGAFDWSEFTRTIIEMEGQAPTPAAIAAREEATRACVTRVMQCDALRPCPIDDAPTPYDVLMTNFCAEAAANCHAQWIECMGNITSVLRPGGRLIVSAVQEADSYAVGSTEFFAVNITTADMAQMLREIGFAPKSIVVESVPADRPERHYRGLIFASALKG